MLFRSRTLGRESKHLLKPTVDTSESTDPQQMLAFPPQGACPLPRPLFRGQRLPIAADLQTLAALHHTCRGYSHSDARQGAPPAGFPNLRDPCFHFGEHFGFDTNILTEHFGELDGPL